MVTVAIVTVTLRRRNPCGSGPWRVSCEAFPLSAVALFRLEDCNALGDRGMPPELICPKVARGERWHSVGER
jgi:hypothetical protein